MFPLPLVITVGRPRGLRFGLLLLLATAAAALWLAHLPSALQVLGTLALLTSAWLYRSPDRPLTFRCLKDGGIELRIGDAWAPLRLLSPPVVLPWLVALRVARSEKHSVRALLIGPGSLPRNEFRRLRVCLLWLTTPATEHPHSPQP